MSRGVGPETRERNERIAAMIRKYPMLTYPEIGTMCDVSGSIVSKVANRYGIQRPRGNKPGITPDSRASACMTCEERKAAPKCASCDILLEALEEDEGIALVNFGNGTEPVCSACVRDYGYRIEGWQKEPADTPPPEDRITRSHDIATARWPLLEISL